MSTEWKVKVARGWRDQAPLEIQRAFAIPTREPTKAGSFALVSGAHLSHAANWKERALFTDLGHSSWMESTLSAIAGFLEVLKRKEIDVVTLAYLSFRPYALVLSPKSVSHSEDAAGILDAIEVFCNTINASDTCSNRESQCEWVAMSCERQQ